MLLGVSGVLRPPRRERPLAAVGHHDQAVRQADQVPHRVVVVARQAERQRVVVLQRRSLMREVVQEAGARGVDRVRVERRVREEAALLIVDGDRRVVVRRGEEHPGCGGVRLKSGDLARRRESW